ncbi:MAG: ABC transporter ATP-binding protein [Candidatus Aureabacteria bacterium]|nr:ABC transporter ATP-binding protein [Candidatus Auribacterota bacterium]
MERIHVHNLGKQYTRRHAVQKSLKATVLSLFRNTVQKEKFWALKDVNFSAKEGETLGIIGPNGAGKSTLLSLIAQTTQPTEGEVQIGGRLSSLLELGAGFHPDLTGRENIYLNGSILGLSKKDINRKFDAIVDFSGIVPFIDSPVKFYSSGMYVRLGFAIAVEVDPDILLMDEIISVGDEEFRKKSLAKVESFKARGKTMLIVSHDLETIKRISDRILYLDSGKVMNLGDPSLVVDEYKNFGIYQKGQITVKDYGTREVIFENIFLKDNKGNVREEFFPGRPLIIEMHYFAQSVIKDPVFGFSLSDSQGKIVLGTNTQLREQLVGTISGRGCVNVKIESLNLQRGVYHLSVACHSPDHKRQYHRKDNFLEFRIALSGEEEGTVYMPVKFERGE